MRPACLLSIILAMAPLRAHSRSEVSPVAAEKAPPPSPRLTLTPAVAKMMRSIESHFSGHPGKRTHILLDRPLYKPGETIWLRTWNLKAQSLQGDTKGVSLYELVSPKGTIITKERFAEEGGVASGYLDIPLAAAGGEHRVRVTSADKSRFERPLIVDGAHTVARIKKRLEFLQKSYGPGEEATAMVEVHGGTGEAMAGLVLKAVIRVDGRELPPVTLTTNDQGGGTIRFTLPPSLEGEGLLTVLISDGAMTESISRPIPLARRDLRLELYPEGGDLVLGLPSRVYFRARLPSGKAAEVSGVMVDDLGREIVPFTAAHAGMGRFDITPEAGRTYRAVITRPEGVAEAVALPAALEQGCALRWYDDLDTQEEALRVGVRCTAEQEVIVTAMLREGVMDTARVRVPHEDEAVIYLRAGGGQGVARVTAFDGALNPLAERLVYRHRRARMHIALTPDKERYAPRDRVTLGVITTDERGQPLEADLALAVVDDAALSQADDKEGHIISRLLLEPELPEPVEEPQVYLDLTDPRSARAMDLLMGTQGYRRFVWVRQARGEAVEDIPPMARREREKEDSREATGPDSDGDGIPDRVDQCPLDPEVTNGIEDEDGCPELDRDGDNIPDSEDRCPDEPEDMDGDTDEDGCADSFKLIRVTGNQRWPFLTVHFPPSSARILPRSFPILDEILSVLQSFPELRVRFEGHTDDRGSARGNKGISERRARAVRQYLIDHGITADRLEAMGWGEDKPMAPNWTQEGREKNRRVEFHILSGTVEYSGYRDGLSRVRVFPPPVYPEKGVRRDFRRTAYWEPRVRTDAKGRGEVSFTLCDSITSFRVLAEGVSRGLVGRDEALLTSSLPFSLAAGLPSEAGVGDALEVPVTLTNETKDIIKVEIQAKITSPLEAMGPLSFTEAVEPGRPRSILLPLRASAGGRGTVELKAQSRGLEDSLSQGMTVMANHHPQTLARSGLIRPGQGTEMVLEVPESVAGTMEARLSLYPGLVSTLISSMEGMVGEPHGCFEQTSSANWPNVLVLRSLKRRGYGSPSLLRRMEGYLTTGYSLLTSFEVGREGFSLWGNPPAEETLTAFGLLQLMDMSRVYPVDQNMLRRTLAWLQSRGPEKDVDSAYMAYSLTEACGERWAGGCELGGIIKRAARLAKESRDPYVLALATLSLLNVPERRDEARTAAERLRVMQDKDGSFPGARESITLSHGHNLEVEATALAAIALLRAGHRSEGERGVLWLYGQRRYGSWGATQATVMALRALSLYDELVAPADARGEVHLTINGQEAGRVRCRPQAEAVVLEGLKLLEGTNRVGLRLDGEGALPYTISVTAIPRVPPSAPQAPVRITTSLERGRVRMGETVRLTAILDPGDKTRPMTLVRIGIPAGLGLQEWQLKALREEQAISSYETRPREAILYLGQLTSVKTVGLDLVARVPGRSEGPASVAYLYYTDDQKHWAPPLAVEVVP